VTRRTCAGLLYTNHAAGALRAEPLLLPGETQDPAGGWLVLCLAQANGQTELRPYPLPLRDPDQMPTEPAQAPGWASFAPGQDAGRIALATDAGYLALWGVRQKGNRDPLLFPLLNDPFAVELGPTPARAQVVRTDAENFWILAHGKLQRVHTTFKPPAGPGLLKRWPHPPALGSPLHEAQHRRGSEGHVVLYTTTQVPGQPTCLASAVDAEGGQPLWQRQLGCVPRRVPLSVGRHVLIRDANGLFLFDPAAVAPSQLSCQDAGVLLTQEALADDRVALLGQGDEALELSWPARAGACKLRLRQIVLAKERKQTQHICALPAAPHGTPALSGGVALVPLANGVTARLNVADGAVVLGPDWRSAGADEQQPGHIVALGAVDFLMTDGSRALKRLHWPSTGLTEARGRAELPHRIVAAPAVVSGAEPRVCVADASGTLTLLDGRLQVLRRWPLGGALTAGPFVRAGKIGCIVGKGRLLWLDPDQERPLWEYALPAEIVGEPPLIEGALIVADVQGQFRALDPQTGRERGAGYTLRANVAPAAAPLAFGADRLFVPLSDGTILLLPLHLLAAPAAEKVAQKIPPLGS
jgi:hypothetical protein